MGAASGRPARELLLPTQEREGGVEVAPRQHPPRGRLWRWLWCFMSRRRLTAQPKFKEHPAPANLALPESQDRATRPPAEAQVLPNFVVRMAVPFLTSSDIARFWSVDRAADDALSLPGLLRELANFRGIDAEKVPTLAHLHLDEEMTVDTNVVTFEFMSTEFSSKSKKALAKIANLMKNHATAEAIIEGHAQPGAPPSIARQISRDRAEAVAAGLEARGVSRGRMEIAAFATSRELINAEFEHEHRRAEIFLTFQGAQFPAERLPARTGQLSRYGLWIMDLDMD